MEPSELLRFVADILERLGIRYFVTGSTVTIVYGEPRFTNDIDIVVDLAPESVGERWVNTLELTDIWRAALGRLRKA